MRLPAVVLEEIREESSALLDLGNELTQVKKDLAECTGQWERLHALTLLTVTSNADPTKRPPAEDLRKAMTLNMLDASHPEMRARLLRLQGESDALVRLIEVRKSRLTALQSELGWLKMEYESGGNRG